MINSPSLSEMHQVTSHVFEGIIKFSTCIQDKVVISDFYRR